MKKNIIAAMTLVLSLGALHTTYAQEKPGVGIGAKKVDDSAILEIKSNDKGVLIPRITLNDLNAFQLAGDTKAESMLIYNIGTSAIPTGFYYWTSGKWELITSQSQLDSVIENLRTEIYEEIEKITKIPGTGPGATDLSYLVAFTPDGANASKGKFSYLVPDKNATTGEITYTLQEITLEDIIKNAETNTLILPVEDEVLQADGSKVKKTVAYRYFSEDVIKTWKAIPGNENKDPEDIDPSLGFFIDVAGVAGDSFIQYLNENKEYIEKTFINIEGNITLHQEADGRWYFEVYDGSSTTPTKTYFNHMETQTSIGKSEVISDGNLPGFAKNTVAPDQTKVTKGEIYYEYVTETDNGQVKNYINLTQDLISTITNNEQLQKDINNVVNNYLEGGANVYYGKIDPADTTAKDVLFSIDENDVRTPIDISQNIINEITTNEEVQNAITKLNRLDLLNREDRPTNTFVNGKEVYRGTRQVSVNAVNPSTLSMPVEIRPKMRSVSPTGEVTYVDDPNVEIGRLLSIQLLSDTGSVVVSTFTDPVVEYGTQFNFDFGQGIMYINLPAGNYQLIYEYIAK